jgi:hypothetical protein
MSDPIEAVVDRVDAELGGFGVRRAGVLAELRDGLEDAAAAYGGAGLPAPEARRRAVADFGDPEHVARHYRATDLGRRSQRTAALLGMGSVLVLTAWTLLGLSQGQRLTDPTVSGFVLITVVAAVVGGAGWWSTRRVLQRGAGPERVASTVAVAVLAICGFTWVFSYTVEPWTTPAEMLRGGWQWVYAVETFSMLLTGAMVAAALRCLVALRRG